MIAHSSNRRRLFGPWSLIGPAALAVLLVFAGAAMAQGVPGQWEETGPGSPCSNGVVPTFQPYGNLFDSPGLPTWQALTVQNGPPNAPAVLVIGFPELGMPLAGGILGPTPTVLMPFALDADGFQGTGFLLGTQPDPLPHGLSIWFQWWIVDPWQPYGWCSTRTVRGTIWSA